MFHFWCDARLYINQLRDNYQNTTISDLYYRGTTNHLPEYHSSYPLNNDLSHEVLVQPLNRRQKILFIYLGNDHEVLLRTYSRNDSIGLTSLCTHLHITGIHSRSAPISAEHLGGCIPGVLQWAQSSLRYTVLKILLEFRVLRWALQWMAGVPSSVYKLWYFGEWFVVPK
jgi:hypothetical protein